MKTQLYHLFCICTIAFWLFSCAPSPENAKGIYNDSSNHLILGFWHGIIIPLAGAGKIIGLNIGLYHAGKSNFSYWVGYVIALSFYFRIVRIFALEAWNSLKQWFSRVYKL